MGRSFHNLHVHAPTARMRERVTRTVLAYAKAAGFVKVARASSADRVIRIGGPGPWLTIEDDGYEISAIAKAIATTKLATLEAYCEASAIVWMALSAGGKRAGGWSQGRRPPARLVEPLLAKGTAAELATAWDEGRRQVFPESALAAVAPLFGMKVDRMLGDANLRGTTLALRRKRAAWVPVYAKGVPSFDVGFGTNQGWGARHLVFEGELEKQGVSLRSKGGPGRGLTLRLGGSALDGGHIEIVEVSHPTFAFVRDGNTFTAADAKIPAGLVQLADWLSLGRRENEKARELEGKSELYVAITYRALKDGECDLTAVVESEGGRDEGVHHIKVNWKPWKPRTARPNTDDHTLFNMHWNRFASAHISLRGDLAAAWAWARPHVLAWSAVSDRKNLSIEVGDDIVLRESLDEETGELSWHRIPELFPTSRTVPFSAASSTFRFGTTSHVPWKMEPGDELAIQLVLAAQSPGDDPAIPFARLTEVCDDAIATGVAYSALVASNRYLPDENTAWEAIASGDAPIKLVAWHATHIRGIDKRIWMSAEHAARIDRVAIERLYTVTDVGRGLRITMEDTRSRKELAPLEELLAPLLPQPR